MTIADPIGDMITRIRNAQLRSLSNVKIPGSKFRERIQHKNTRSRRYTKRNKSRIYSR